MPRLSSPIDSLPSTAEVVVIGSGYGASIAASRLARAGREVVLLERGREIQPGEYPDTQGEALREMQFDLPDFDEKGRNHHGSRTGLFDFRVNKDVNVLIGCGLGGTSLINANVALRAEPRVFDDPAWPRALFADKGAALERGYARAEAMLKPAPFPASVATPTKLAVLEKMSKPIVESVPGGRFYRPPINVNFKVDGPNHVGVEQKPCNQCGDCVTGCNVKAKNTLLMNYLPDAWNHGARIFTEVSVRSIERKNKRWLVKCELIGLGREKFAAPTFDIEADIVVLGAGTLGSTEILLRSKADGLPLSDRIGSRFTGNGDVLAFAYNCDQKVNGVGWGHASPKGREVGPCITGIIDLRGRKDLTDGMVIQEGSMPGALAATLPLGMAAAAHAVGDDTDSGVADFLREAGREALSLVGGAHHGAMANTQTFLIMTHDDGKGEMRLDEDRLRVDWPGVGSEPIFDTANKRLRDATAATGGTFVKDPIWTKVLGKQLVTVHPLGGCPMGEVADSGVVDHEGRVFSGASGSAVHDGLYVVDGAVIPRPLGVNPLLTICALAERTCELMAARRGFRYDDTPTSKAKAAPPPEKPALRFTETMRGFWAKGVPDFEAGRARGEASGSRMEFTLTILSDDVERMLSDPAHVAAIVGTVTAPTLSDDPLDVSGGAFQLFVKDPSRPNTRLMRYRMRLTADDGEQYFFDGTKVVRDDAGLDLWKDTTTLFVVVHEGPDADPKKVLGRGILKILLPDFVRQLTTVEITGEPSLPRRLGYVAKFGGFFTGTLLDTYGSVFARPTVFDPDAPPRKKRPLRAPAPEVVPVATSDGVKIRLTRYRGGDKGPVLLSHGLGVSAKIFSLDTVDTNLVECLVAHGYDVWNLDHRVSIDLPAARLRSTGDDIATKDYPAAVAKILELTGAGSIQAVVHCWGSTTFFLAMLSGLKGVRSAVASQVATHAIAPFSTKWKTGLHIPGFMDKIGIPSLDAYVDTHEKWWEKLADAALRFYPVGERCSDPVCHRITFLYSPLYRHDKLNDLTHGTLHETFGVANIESFKHLGQIVNAGHLVNAAGENVYLPHLERLAIPITLISGAENECFLPKSTAITEDILAEKNGHALYHRRVIPGYGHIDCIMGRDAATDVFPHIVAALDATPA